MMGIGNLYKIYEGFLNDTIFTDEVLLSYGYNESEINKLIISNVLRRKENTYEFIDNSGLCMYIDAHLRRSNPQRIIPSLKKVILNAPKYTVPYVKIFIQYIEEGDYATGLEYLQKVMEIDNNSERLCDYRVYLYLVSFLTKLPANLQAEVDGMQLTDLLPASKDIRFQKTDSQYQIRENIYKKRFIKAFNILIHNKEENRGAKFFELACGLLLDKNIKKIKARNAYIKKMVAAKKYALLQETLENNQKQMPLSLYEESILKLLTIYKNIQETKEIPPIIISSSGNIYNAIACNNFPYLIKIYSQMQDKVYLEQYRPLLLIALDIESLIAKINSSFKPKVFNSSLLEAIKEELDKNNYLNSFPLIYDYLRIIRQTDYEFLIINLLEKGVIEGDFSEVLTALTELSTQSGIDINKYVAIFYQSLDTGDYLAAQIYLNIIKSSKRYSDIYVLEKVLEKELKNNLNIEDFQEREIILNEINILYHNSVFNREKQIVEDSDMMNIIRDNMALLNERHLVILEPMSARMRKRMHNTANIMGNVYSFSIGLGNERRCALIKRNNPENSKTIRDVLGELNIYLKRENYPEALKCGISLLENYPVFNSYIFGIIGSIYEKLNDLAQAFNFYLAANELGVREKKGPLYQNKIKDLEIIKEDKQNRTRKKREE